MFSKYLIDNYSLSKKQQMQINKCKKGQRYRNQNKVVQHSFYNKKLGKDHNKGQLGSSPVGCKLGNRTIPISSTETKQLQRQVRQELSKVLY